MVPGDTVLADLVLVLPDFAIYWESPDNLFREDDGTYSACGVFAQLSDYVRERFRDLSEEQLRGVGQLVRKYFNAGEEMRGVLGACLVENLQFEACSNVFRENVDGVILSHFHFEGR